MRLINSSVILLLIILLLALSIRVYHLDVEDLELAEAFRLTEANSFSSAFFQPLNAEEHPPLYLIFLYFWRFLGESAFMLRLSSVLFGIGAIFFIYLIGKELFGRVTGLIAALIMALNPLHIDYSQNLEPYSLTVFLSFLSVYFFIMALEFGKFKYFLWFGFTILLAGYSDYFIAFLIMALILSLLFNYQKYRNRINSLIVSGSVLFLSFIPLILMGLFQFLSILATDKFDSIRHPLWYVLIIPYNLVTLVVGRGSIFFDDSFFPLINWLPLLAVIIILFGFLFIKGILPFGVHKEKKIFLLSCFSIPIISLYLISFVSPMYLDAHRFLFISFPFFILVANGLASIKNKKIFNLLLIIILILGVIFIYSNFHQQNKAKISEISSFVEYNYREGDIVAVLPQEYLPVLWYYLPDNIPATSFPEHFPLDVYTPFERIDFSMQTIDPESIPIFLKYQAELSLRYNRLWYVIDLGRSSSGEDKNNFVLNYLSQHYELKFSKISSDGKIGLYLFSFDS